MSDFQYTECTLEKKCDLLRGSLIENWQRPRHVHSNLNNAAHIKIVSRDDNLIAAASLGSDLRYYTLFALIQNCIKADIVQASASELFRKSMCSASFRRSKRIQSHAMLEIERVNAISTPSIHLPPALLLHLRQDVWLLFPCRRVCS